MALRTAHTYSTPKGTVNTRKHTFAGKGRGPAGTRKVRPVTAAQAPTVTVSSSGHISSSGFNARRAARAAERSATASVRRVRRIAQMGRPAPRIASPQPVKVRLLPASKPVKFRGKPTAGTPTLGSLRQAAKTGTLKTTPKGFVSTPQVRRVAKGLRQAQKVYAKTAQPSLKGLSPAERAVAPIVVKQAHKQGLEPALLMSQIRQESGFNPGAVSNKGAQGLTQFIPSTAAEYGVRPGTSKPAVKSQIRGQAKYMADLGAGADQRKALAGYYGADSPSYYGPILGGKRDYAALDKPTKANPKVVARLAVAKQRAKALGLKPTVATSVPKKLLGRFKAAQKAAQELEHAHLPYVWGGGHGTPGGLDCSGAVSYVLNKMGVLKGSLVSGDMGKVLKPGPGAVTVFYNGEHTFMKIGNRYFGTSNSNPRGGAGFFPASVGNAEVSSGNAAGAYSVGHVAGLDQKVAVALGVTNFPGMTLSSSGTSATINSGAGATVGKPGFSSKPIHLTRTQIIKGRQRQLTKIARTMGETASSAVISTPTLADLERKYGKAAA